MNRGVGCHAGTARMHTHTHTHTHTFRRCRAPRSVLARVCARMDTDTDTDADMGKGIDMGIGMALCTSLTRSSSDAHAASGSSPEMLPRASHLGVTYPRVLTTSAGWWDMRCS